MKQMEEQVTEKGKKKDFKKMKLIKQKSLIKYRLFYTFLLPSNMSTCVYEEE